MQRSRSSNGKWSLEVSRWKLYMNQLLTMPTFGTMAQRSSKRQASLDCVRFRFCRLRLFHSNSGQIDVNFGHVVLNELLSAYVGPFAIEMMHLD
jgi:hypothetical protein